MYVIYMKKINQPNALPIAYSQQVISIKQARKYRKIEICEADFIMCCANYPQFLWNIREIKTRQLIRSNNHEVLHVWNKQLGRV